MKRLPRPTLNRIYNPIDEHAVDSAWCNTVMLNKATETYTCYSGIPVICTSDISGICEDGVIYNNFRLGCPSADIYSADPGYDQYSSSELYRLQNPVGSADWAEHHSIYPCAERYLLIQKMLQNYLTYPTYYVDKYSAFNDTSAIPNDYSDFDPTKNFFATIPQSAWLEFVEAAHTSFINSLSQDEGINGKYDSDSYEKKLVVDNIRSNSGDFNPTIIIKENNKTIVYSETLEEFEKEYQAFIEMLKTQKTQ